MALITSLFTEYLSFLLSIKGTNTHKLFLKKSQDSLFSLSPQCSKQNSCPTNVALPLMIMPIFSPHTLG